MLTEGLLDLALEHLETSEKQERGPCSARVLRKEGSVIQGDGEMRCWG